MANTVQAAQVPPAEAVRYHSLDALRAWAMSMGIVLHAAWIMTPGESGAPMTDASASEFTGYIDAAIHMFRMQLFFVLAGFLLACSCASEGLSAFCETAPCESLCRSWFSGLCFGLR
ncbi:MAG: acyltransferase family protein [bacterium]|nr:acyltransferase family protein [bacterium]